MKKDKYVSFLRRCANTNLQGQKTITVFLKIKQLLPYGFARHNTVTSGIIAGHVANLNKCMSLFLFKWPLLFHVKENDEICILGIKIIRNDNLSRVVTISMVSLERDMVQWLERALCRADSSPYWCRIFREISCFSLLNLEALLRCCVLGQGTPPSNASLENIT